VSRETRRIGWLGGGACLALALAALGLLLPAAADWLVTHDGQRIETDGPYRVEDRLIVFHHKDGTLSSVRRSSIDLDASERLTREMAELARAPRVEPETEPRPKATIRLTEKELPPAGRLADPAGEEGEGGAGASSAPAPPDSGPGESLQIISWEEIESRDGASLAFMGEVRNVTERWALGIAVEVVLYDREGEQIASSSATLTTTALPPRESARFRASFPQVYDYGRVEFRSSGALVDRRPAGDDAAAEAGDEEPAAPPTEPEGEG
jgi:hypothetical protein